MLEELAKGSAGAALGIYVQTSLAAAVLANIAEAELAQQLVPQLLSGQMTGAWAHADVILVVARTSEEPGKLRGLSVFAVDGNSEGLTRTSLAKLGMRPSELAELHFYDCVVSPDRLVGVLDGGFRQCLTVLSQGRVFAGALALGLGRSALEAAVTHVGTREQFGAPLAAKQAVRMTIGEMTARLRAVRHLVYDAADKLERGEAYDTDASIAKLVSSETATWVSERCLHLHGASGYMLDSPAQRFYRDCKINEWGEGINEIQREMIFEAVSKGYTP